MLGGIHMYLALAVAKPCGPSLVVDWIRTPYCGQCHMFRMGNIYYKAGRGGGNVGDQYHRTANGPVGDAPRAADSLMAR